MTARTGHVPATQRAALPNYDMAISGSLRAAMRHDPSNAKESNPKDSEAAAIALLAQQAICTEASKMIMVQNYHN